MTNTQVKYIVENILNDQPYTSGNAKGYTILLNNFSFIINKDEILYTDINRWRYKFDFTNGLVERVMVRLFSTDITKTPAHNNYDIYNGNVYEYITDKQGKIICDIYMMNSIIMFIPQPEVEL